MPAQSNYFPPFLYICMYRMHTYVHTYTYTYVHIHFPTFIQCMHNQTAMAETARAITL